ncbi:chromosome partitioning protein ParB [Nostoc sp. UHCC 0251]|uniref:chromosome partitioning protein ParB n=1 Tax=Nostoc sp. UHCC 0251 TaxID=3110240 RepID=UPI002B20F4C6|nr:chromosome partitioning protein ParB [Nostoc sp. UHCC 0251]MEA5627919.1 chromosome partitioning protein ParB [Nostoc sp. UHCC 0251]
MKFYTVDVKNISCDVPASNFSNDALNSLADMIIESGGIIRPLVLKTTGLETYTVVDGYFEYYAAVRAREKNPRQCEMVNAFVISPKNEDEIFKQVAAFRELASDNKPEIQTPIKTNNSESISKNNDFNLLEKQINDLRSELAQERQERQKLYETLKLIESQIPKQITPLEAFNTLSLLELTFRLRTAGFTDKKAVQVAESLEKERKKKNFESLKDILARVKITSGKKQIKGISSDKMVDIVDSWSRILFI